jgi:hypothetical protein
LCGGMMAGLAFQATFTIVNTTITRTDLRIEHLFD